ncbi:MAG TPA: TIGR00297 family protein [Acidobacteria bacterium]|nr:TIGR00297 family protein [Acidobacteriota bacterium]
MGTFGREMARKSVHVAMGGFAFLLVWLTPWQAALLAAGALLHNLFLLPLYGGRRIFRGEAAERGHDLGIVLYPASILALVLIFPHRPEIVAAAWGLLAFGDGMATVAGTLARGRGGRLPWNPDKSWIGLAAFGLFGGAGAAALYGWTLGVAVEASWLLPVLIVTVVMAVAESLPLGLDDNIVVSVGGGALLCAALAIDPQLLVAKKELLAGRLVMAVAVNLLLGLAALRAGSVDRSGMLHGALLGGAILVFGGAGSFLMLFAFFFLGSAATRLGYATKAAEGTAQEKGGARGAANAWANAGAGALFALLAAGSPQPAPYLLALVAAFATATADTLGSEIGQAYGRRTFLVTTFRPVPRGTDGAISLEGTLAGIAGSLLVGLLGWGVGVITLEAVAWVVIAAWVGTTLESYLGALLERRAQINNEAQNFLNTLVGGLVAMALWTWL